MKLPTPFLLIFFVALACSPRKTPKEESAEDVTINADGSKTLRSFFKNKKVKSEVTYRDGLRNGIARSYDDGGNLTLEMNYVNDKREGESKRFYTGGAIFQTTQYRNDVMEGKQLKFRSDGRPLSEARYENDYPCLGLMEYFDNGKPRTKFPDLIIKPIDRIAASGQYTLELSMSSKVTRVKFYTGKLTPSGCLSDSNNGVLMDETRRVGIVKYVLFPGQFIMEELNVVAVVETGNGNSYVCQKAFNVAIKN